MVMNESNENYLETILVLNHRLGNVRSVDIANEMNFKKPSVSVAMKNLRENGYITVSPEGYIHLTESGLEVAEKIYERHTILSNWLTMLPECHSMYHGEKVAFGTIVQLVLEDAPTEKLEEVLGFCIELGLPVTMKELGVAELTREQAMIVAEAACAPEDTMCNMPFEVTPEMVANAILGADALGHYYLMDE